MMIDNQMTRRKDIGNILTSDFHKYIINLQKILRIYCVIITQKQMQHSERWSICTGLHV